ncbi:T9SS type A sorting domain-containing protein [Mesonia aestuariivivens]|uniref:T9SS type A sorting domain-containing protein n=1 Tax=Mesonia aestuariivivens TaxID=2796128 RepID=A0ABS6W3L1_9FLAO|nr:T9SS type A sorting domain-containing protein [Mesonia aestuariivivens]MBW2962081.1 T9SS type A sorting domain-containing protein [Mesonia aestuariivivens]
MQKTIKTIVFTLLLIVSYNANAAKNFEVAVAKNQILMVELNDAQAGDMLTLLDAEGKVLFKEMNLTSDFQKQLSLEMVPDGKYFLHLEDENSIYAREIVKRKQTITVNEASKIIFKPTFKEENNQLKVAFTNPNEEIMHLYVYDEKGNIVTSLKNNDLVIKKTFDFSKVPAGNYMLAVVSSERSFYKSIRTK